MIYTALGVQVFVWLAVLGIFLASRRATIFHPLTIYLAFHGLVFVIRPLLVELLGFTGVFDFMGVQPRDQDVLLTLAISSTGLVVFALMSITVGGAIPGFSTARPLPFSLAQKRALIVTTILLTPLIAYSMKALMTGEMSGENLGGTFILTGASGYTLEAQFMAGPLICLWLGVTRFSRAVVVPVLFYVAYRSYAGWNRWTIVLLFVAISLVYSWQNRKKWIPRWSVMLSIPLYFLFLTLGQNRDYFRQLFSGDVSQQFETSLSRIDRLRKKYDTQDFANFDYLCFIVAVVPERTEAFTYGGQYLQIFTEPIPRKLWKEKPIGAPVRLFNLNAYGNFNGLTPSLVGDGWMSGGWIGVIVVLGLAGTFCGLAHRRFWKNVNNNTAVLFYLVSLATFPQWFRDGGISIVKFLFWNLSPLMIWQGATWLMGDRLVPAYTEVLPRSYQIRLVPLKERHERPTTSQDETRMNKRSEVELDCQSPACSVIENSGSDGRHHFSL